MKKLLLVMSIFSLGLLMMTSSCKDEFHIPETSYVDSLPPVIKIVSPTSDSVFIGQASIPIKLELSDDYELKSVSVRIIPSDFNLPEYNLTQDLTGLSEYTFEDSYTLPTSDSMTYEVNVDALDFVGNDPLPIQYSFTAK